MSVYRRPDPLPRPRLRPQQAPSPLQPIRPDPEDLNQLVARKIFDAIQDGDFAEGAILPNEFALGEALGVSRTALREAIKGLSSKGMLETRRKRGTRVTDSSQWTVIDVEVITWLRKRETNGVSLELWQSLKLVMPEIARLAAVNPMRLRLGPVATARDALTVAAVLADIARLSGNRFLSSLASVALLNLATDDLPFLEARLGAAPSGAIESLWSAVGAGDRETAARAMETIFGTVRQKDDLAARMSV